MGDPPKVSALITVIHVIVCLLMVSIILLQHGKGADIGAAFGGGSHTLFGARGATTFLAKVTLTCAAIFMVTSITLAISARHKAGTSVIDQMGETQDFFDQSTAPAELPDLTPGAAPEGGAAPEPAPAPGK
jgi:preprotein translocase subunit SecG